MTGVLYRLKEFDNGYKILSFKQVSRECCASSCWEGMCHVQNHGMSVMLLTARHKGACMLPTSWLAISMQCPQLMLAGSVAVLFPCFRPVLQVDSIDNGALVRRGASEVWEPDDIGSALTALGQSSSSNSSSRSSTGSKSHVQRATDKWLKVVGEDFSLPLDQHEAYRVSGEWTKHPTYGWQIRSGRCTRAMMECSCACC